MGKIKRTDKRKTTYYAKLKTRNRLYAGKYFRRERWLYSFILWKSEYQIEEGISRLREAILVCEK